ncbi:alpha/beta hydrolase family protein [Chitinophaga agrisoli]|nr:prolyl oligopeptidase family serine peptidase [Chitinophaga agrisoli]
MRSFSLMLLLSIRIFCCLGQKPPIDASAYDAWPMLHSLIVTDDGSFVAYSIRRTDLQKNDTLVIQSVAGNRKINIPVQGMALAAFQQEDQLAVFMKAADTIGILHLQTFAVTYIPGAFALKAPKRGTKTFISYRLKGQDNKLVLHNLASGVRQEFTDVLNCNFSDDGAQLLLQTAVKPGRQLSLVDLVTGRHTKFWTGRKLGKAIFDRDGRQLAFWAQTDSSRQDLSLWYYKTGAAQPLLLADAAPGDNMTFNNDFLRFTKNGERLFIQLKENREPYPDTDEVKVNVWSYNDAMLQPQQLANAQSPHSFLAVADIKNRRITRIAQENDYLLALLRDGDNDDFIPAMNLEGDLFFRERKWNPASRPALYVIDTKDGSRKRLCQPDKEVSLAHLSPDNKYVVYYNPEERNYFSYELASGLTRNLTAGIPVIWTTYNQNDMPDSLYMPVGVAGWMKDAPGLLIYDQYDIWQIDLSGKRSPLNITNGYGRQHNIVFQLLQERDESIVGYKQVITLAAFGRTKKNAGFYRIKPGGKQDPQLLDMQPAYYDLGRMPIIKAAKTGLYIFQRMSATDYPNYYATTDFKTFRQLSYLQPEKKYNWLTAELVQWPTPDGDIAEGILYKPEDFDPHKKYPLIFYMYERFSDRLHAYLTPAPADGPLNIPYFVSNGYLVLAPDIHYKIGAPMKSAYNTVVSGARYLSRFEWVDTARMGIQGHSWGAYETNYIITHTSLFAAAMSAAGVSDLVSSYGSISHGGVSRQHFYEMNQTRIGATLWERPDLYIENSAIFHADKVTTPLLMLGNKEDGAVPFAQGVELFTALRRLGKKVWMLQYDGEGHIVGEDAAAKDYSIRQMQFFNHYLKAAPAPQWMIRGIPAYMKGKDKGLQLEHGQQVSKREG